MAADLVFVGGRTVGVTGGRITAVGGDPGELIGPRTEVVEVRDRLLLPGFQDAHVHAVGGGIELGSCDLVGADTADECLRRVRAYAAAHPDREWITGSGWSMECFDGGLPHRTQLDAVLPDRPVLLVNRDHHGTWVNSRALELAGITDRTQDPADGRIERDPDGVPTGMLQEGAADLVARLVPDITLDDKVAGLLRAQESLHAFGITAWQDPLLGEHGAMPDPTDAYLAAGERLTARVSGALWWDRTRGAEQLDELFAKRELLQHNGILASTVKIMQDGIAENQTAAMLAPYLGCDGNAGLSFIEPRALAQHVTVLDAHGFAVHFHALGDRAVRESLDAVAAAQASNGDTGNRHHLAHLQVVHPDDIPRFRELGATANIQPLWAVHEPQMDELTIPFLGAERAAWQYPFGDLLRSGARIAAGSDWPVSSPDPIQGIHVAVNRTPYGVDVPPFLPDQRIGLDAAIAAYTAGSAYVNRLDDTGAIRGGNRADLVLLDRNPYHGPASEIGATGVAMTFVGGRCVYRRPGLQY